MKTAEYWSSEIGNSMRPLEASIKEIQLDAQRDGWRKGMTDAAEEVNLEMKRRSQTQDLIKAHHAIVSARDKGQQ